MFITGWSANAARGSRASLRTEDGALRLDYTLAGHGAFAIARCEMRTVLPPHYVVTLQLRGEGSPSELQVKLVDVSGANVWWWRRPGFAPTAAGARLVLRRASLAFAWGPASGGEPSEIGAVEIALASDAGAAGRLWIEDFRIEPREPAAGAPRAESVRTWTKGERSFHELDLGALRELGGLVVQYAGQVAPASRLLASDDGATWRAVAEDPGGAGSRRWLRSGEIEARCLRLEVAASATNPRCEVVPIELAASPARHAAALARAAPRGRYPRHLLAEHAAWAVVGGDGDSRKGLLGADGALEIAAESFSIEPFLEIDGRRLSWADVEVRLSLSDDRLPIPSVTWECEGLRLCITAFASGAPGASALVALYRVENLGGAARGVRLVLALRPFQVTPAWQSLNLHGAVAPITQLERTGSRVRVNGAHEVAAVTALDGFGPAEAGPGLDDPCGFAEGELVYELPLAPGATEVVVAAVPLFEATPPLPAGLARAAAAAWGEARLAEATLSWRARLACVPIELPPCAAAFEQSLVASLAWILVNREGPRIQPGPRAYRRSWIRDGALTSCALAEMGFAEEARAFFRWYAPHQHPDGRVPCAVDRRGVDLAVEHDSHGELVWGIAETFRLTGDQAFLRELWPYARKAADAITLLRAQRLGDAHRGTACFGLLPESISHEGYAASPVHAYWDDFFAVRALADAAELARAVGETGSAARFARERDAMRADLAASIAATMKQHGIDYLPGSVELGDFDPTSSAIAFDPCGEAGRLPRAALERTFERYWQEFDARRRRETAADAYTPYEIRNATALLQLGWKERALALLGWLVEEQRPPAWRQWPEVSTRDPRAPRFLGDLPHGWVASSFVRTLRRLIVYERAEDEALVLAAGVPEAWLAAPGVRVRGLPTWWGPLDLTLVARGPGCVRMSFGGSLRPPPGGLVIESPLARPLREVVIDGHTRPATDPRRLHLRDIPHEVELRY